LVIRSKEERGQRVGVRISKGSCEQSHLVFFASHFSQTVVIVNEGGKFQEKNLKLGGLYFSSSFISAES